MPVSAHGHQVASFLFDPFDDLVGGFSVGQFGFGGNAGGLELFSDLAQIGGVFGNFGTDRVGAVGSGGPSVGDVKQDQAAVGEFGELLDVLDDGAVGRGAVQGYEDGFVHEFCLGSSDSTA